MNKRCVACQKGTDEVPLITVEFRGANFWVCPQHLPVLIHDPAQLIGKLPGAETFKPSDIHD